MTAEIYTHDKQLHKAWSLSEGRQRINTDDLYDFNDPVSDTANCSTPLQDEPTQREGELIAEMQEMRLQMEREKEMRLQLEREKEEMRLQIERKEDQEEIAQEQDKLVPGKRKR